MRDRRFDPMVDDEALGREIERALAVDPSPEFVAGIRRRVAAERVPRFDAWVARWLLVAGGAVAAAAVAVAIYLGLPLPANRSEPAEPTTIARADAAPTKVVPNRGQVPTESARTAGPRGGRGAAAQAARVRTEERPSSSSGATPARGAVNPFPEVIVAASEARAFRQLLAMAQTGRIEVVDMADTEGVPGTLLAPEAPAIVIEPITIAPIEIVSTLQGDAE
jgi:hypothetical protein